MGLSTVSVYTADQQDPMGERTLVASGSRIPMRRKLLNLATLLLGIVAAITRRPVTVRYGETPAFGTVTFSGASGTVGCTLNGVALTFAHGASDQADSNTMVTTINASANALVVDLVKASNYAGTLTLVSCAAGTKLLIAGVVMTAMQSTSSPPPSGEFSIAGNDNADATALAAAINAHSLLREKVVATAATNVVTVRALDAAPTDLSLQVLSGSGATASSGSVLAPVTTVCISSLWKGTVGNCLTLAASGTGVTASGARLTGGTLGNVVTI